jgi:hypothetical protein
MTAGSTRSVGIASLYAALLAAAINATIYVISYAAGIIPWSMLSPGRGVSITPRLVIAVSVGGALAGGILYAIIRRSASNPVRKFRIAATAVLFASFIAPLSIPTFTTALMIVLDLMHIVVYAATVWALTVWSQNRRITASA